MEIDEYEVELGYEEIEVKKNGRQRGAGKRKGKPVKFSKGRKGKRCAASQLAGNCNISEAADIKDEITSDDNSTNVETAAGPSRLTRNTPRRNYSDDKSESDQEENNSGSDTEFKLKNGLRTDNKRKGASSENSSLVVEKANGPKQAKKEKSDGPNVRPTEKFSCDLCSKSFKNKESFRRHVRRHEDPDALLNCPHCDFKTLQKSTWVQHLAVIHKEDPHGNRLSEDMKCTHCSFSCVTKYQLKAHIVRKHGDKPFVCPECPYRSSSKSDIEKHISIRHRKERFNLCHICGFCSQTKGGYNRHVRSHEKIKPFYCTICNKRYADSPKLKSHLLRHVSDEKQFVCQYCGHSCRRLDNLQMHLKRIHKTTTTSEDARTFYQNSKEISKIPDISSSPQQPLVSVESHQPLTSHCQEYAECEIPESVVITLSQALNHTVEI